MTTTTSNDSKLVHISPTKIDPDPGNRTTKIDKAFKDSVAAHGVLEPIIVVADAQTGRYQLIAGERRWKAATAAVLESIPAVVHESLTETQRVVLQVTENLHRADLTPAQEAQQCVRLVTLGMGVKDLASAIGRSQGFVRDRLKIAELPAKARRKIDAGKWSIDDGLAAHQLLEYPEALEALLEQTGRFVNVENTVNQHFRTLERQADFDALVDKATKAGKTLVTPDEHGKVPGTVLEDIGIDQDEHASEDCAAYLVKVGFNGATLTQICTNRKNHNKAGKSDVKATKRSANALTDEQLAVRRQQRETKEHRHEAIAEHVSAKVSRPEADAMIYRYVIDTAHADTAKLACKFLGIPKAEQGHTYWPRLLETAAYKNDAALARCALAVAAAHADRSFEGWGSDNPLPKTFKAWLKKKGWKPLRHPKTKSDPK